MDGRRTMTAAEPMAEHRDGMRRTAEAEARAMRREAMAYLALFAIGQICAAVVAVVLPRLLGVHRRVCTDGCAPGKGMRAEDGGSRHSRTGFCEDITEKGIRMHDCTFCGRGCDVVQRMMLCRGIYLDETGCDIFSIPPTGGWGMRTRIAVLSP